MRGKGKGMTPSLNHHEAPPRSSPQQNPPVGAGKRREGLLWRLGQLQRSRKEGESRAVLEEPPPPDVVLFGGNAGGSGGGGGGAGGVDLEGGVKMILGGLGIPSPQEEERGEDAWWWEGEERLICFHSGCDGHMVRGRVVLTRAHAYYSRTRRLAFFSVSPPPKTLIPDHSHPMPSHTPVAGSHHDASRFRAGW